MHADDTGPKLALLRRDHSAGFDISGKANHALKTAPIITGDAFNVMGSTVFPQRALYGSILETSTGVQVKSSDLYINTNTPFSGVVCGVQGSGKSHSTSVLLEGCLIPDKSLGTLPEPLSALLFHFNTAAGTGEPSPCEAACLGSLEETFGCGATPPTVVVLVFPKHLTMMRRVYSRLPGVRVDPLHFSPDDLSGERMLAMMKLDQDQHMPLYMDYIMTILRNMVPFSYKEFRYRLENENFLGPQKAMLDIRLNILDSCLEGGNTSNCVSKHFKKGQLTIIDLSSPFIDAASACGFFEMTLGLFTQASTTAFGKLVVLDEAHKYLTNSGPSSRLTESLLSVIRDQRHLGTRVLISTQEPTVVPSIFLDLCSFVIAHRFSSQKWLDHLNQHISVVDARWGSKVLNLKTGEAMVFSPAALVLRQDHLGQGPSLEAASLDKVVPLGQGYLIVRSKNRITKDGGQSVMAVEPTYSADRMPESDKESPVSSSKSLAEVVDSPSLLWMGQLDIDEERPRMYDNPDFMSSSLQIDNKSFDTVSPSHVGKNSAAVIMPARSTNATGFIQSAPDVNNQNWRATTAGSSKSSGPALKTGEGATQPPEIRFEPLISILTKKTKKGQYQIYFSDLESRLEKLHHPPSEELGVYVKEAEQANMVEVGVFKGMQYVQLVDTGDQWCPRGEYVPLVRAMRTFLDFGEECPKCSEVARKIYETHPGVVRGKFKTYISGAKDAGVVVRRKHDRIQLVSH